MGAGALNDVKRRIVAAARRADRDPSDIRLLAVSKGRSDEAVRELYDAGQRAFGENRPQGLVARIRGHLPDDIDWHFIGNVQRRAIKVIAPQIVLLHSLDRDSIVEAWGRLENPPPALIEVNIGSEPQKHGFEPGQVRRTADRVTDLGIPLHGLMIIPPRVQEANDARRWFSELRELSELVRIDHPSAVELSMGMTDDFEVAVEEGSTIVRVGRAIFEAAPSIRTHPSPED